MNWRSFISAVGVGVLVGCAPEPEVETSEPVPPISGAQIDSMTRSLREAGVSPAQWANVLRRDDGTRAVVHARRDEDLGPEEQDEFCAFVRDTTSRELQTGQELEIYVIRSDGVFACR